MVVNRMLTPNHERFVFQLVVMIGAFFNYTPQSYRENSRVEGGNMAVIFRKIKNDGKKMF